MAKDKCTTTKEIQRELCSCDNCHEARCNIMAKVNRAIQLSIRDIVKNDESNLPFGEKLFTALLGLGETAAEEKILYYTNGLKKPLTSEEIESLENWHQRDMRHEIQYLDDDMKPTIKELN